MLSKAFPSSLRAAQWVVLLNALWLPGHAALAQTKPRPAAKPAIQAKPATQAKPAAKAKPAPQPAARAKAKPLAAVSVAEGVPLKRVGYSPLPYSGRQLVLTVGKATGKPTTTPVHVQVLDSLLRPMQQRDLALRGHCELLGTHPALAARHVLYQFRQHNRLRADSVFSLVFDAQGAVVSQQTAKYLRGKQRQLKPLNLPTADVVAQSVGSTRRRFSIESLTPAQHLRWQQPFVAPKGAARLNASAADSTHIWLLLTEHANSRRNTPVAVCLDAATGRQLSRTPLSTGPGLREASACTMGPGHSVTIVGQSFAGKRPKNGRIGELFVLRLRPDGSVLADQPVALEPLPRRHKVIWEQVQESPTGRLRIVGETYTKTSAGAMVGFYAVTYAATLSYWGVTQTVLRPRNLLLLDLDANGKLTHSQAVDLPKGGSRYEGRYRAARRMARLAAEHGTFRYRATGPDNVTLLRTKEQLLEVKPGGKAPIALRAQPEGSAQDIVSTSGHHLLVTDYNKKKKQFSLLRLPYK